MVAGDPSATLSLAALEFAYRDFPALRAVTASFASERIAILGPNGAGKSTLMSILDTSRRPRSGSFEHRDLTPLDGDLRAYRRHLGVVPQSLSMMPGYSCREILRYACWLRGVSSSDTPGRVDEALASVGLLDRAGTAVRKLSGGMRQRLALAQALVNRPTLMLLDEPTVGLDPRQRVQLRELLAGFQNTTVVFATHLVDDVAALAEEIAVLDEGRLLWSGRTVDFVDGGKVTATAIEKRYLELVEQAS